MKSVNKISTFLTLHALSANATKGWLSLGTRQFSCQMGRAGLTAMKREGDGATPMGRWPVRSVHYRADRVARPQTALPVNIIERRDGWCDDPRDRNYNRAVSLPYPDSTESLWREDQAYDLIVVLDYNISRRSMHRGSAIFMHLTHDDKRPTAGCLAFRERDLQMIVKHIRPGSRICIQ